MRLYPIHSLTKNYLLVVIFVSATKIDRLNNPLYYSGHLSWGEVISTSLYATISLTILDLIVQTIIYFGLRKRTKLFDKGNKFVIGVLLHVPTLLFYSIGMDLSDFWTGSILAISLSTIFSGVIYYMLNKGQENKIKAETV